MTTGTLQQGATAVLLDAAGNGMIARTAAQTSTARTITGTTNQVTVSNGDGVAGNPTLNVGSDVVQIDQAQTYTAGSKQTFQNSATTAGANLATSADPSTLAQGDLWLNASDLKWRGAAATQTAERLANKDAASGYAGLTAGTKLNLAQGQEVWAAADLTSYASTSGTGTQAILSTITSPLTNDVLTWSGTNWINQAPTGGGSWSSLTAPTAAVSMVSDAVAETATFDFQA
ncbi:MAG: hypothetical protein ACREJC_14560, partial [Tepidisphaeraceae bacterium]